MSALEQIGAPLVHLQRELRELFALLARTVWLSARGRRDWRAIVFQAYQIGNRSVFFVSVTMGFIGMIMVFQAGLQALKIVPDLSMLGATFAELLVRDLAASIGAMPAPTRASRPRSARWSSPSRSTRCGCRPPTRSSTSSCRGSSARS